MIKRVAVLGALLFAQGCSSESGSDFKQYVTLMRQAVSSTMHPTGVTLKEAAAIPYATMGWRLNAGPQNIIVLASDTTHQQMWTSAAHIVLLTENGLLKKTVGLPHDLGALTPGSGASLTPPSLALQGPYMDRRSADFPDINVYGAMVICRGLNKGRSTITILGKALQTMRVEESCNCQSQNWSFQNIYWLDATSGYVWRSVQHIHPAGDVIEAETLRPPE